MMMACATAKNEAGLVLMCPAVTPTVRRHELRYFGQRQVKEEAARLLDSGIMLEEPPCMKLSWDVCSTSKSGDLRPITAPPGLDAESIKQAEPARVQSCVSAINAFLSGDVGSNLPLLAQMYDERTKAYSNGQSMDELCAEQYDEGSETYSNGLSAECQSMDELPDLPVDCQSMEELPKSMEELPTLLQSSKSQAADSFAPWHSKETCDASPPLKAGLGLPLSAHTYDEYAPDCADGQTDCFPLGCESLVALAILDAKSAQQQVDLTDAFSNLKGHSVLEFMRLQTTCQKAAKRWLAMLFQGDATPNGILDVARNGGAVYAQVCHAMIGELAMWLCQITPAPIDPTLQHKVNIAGKFLIKLLKSGMLDVAGEVAAKKCLQHCQVKKSNAQVKSFHKKSLNSVLDRHHAAQQLRRSRHA